MKKLPKISLIVMTCAALAQTSGSVSAATADESTTGAGAAVPVLQIEAGNATGKVDPMFFGLMTEEINFSYEGGIYGELIRNRTFKANAQNPAFWNAVGDTAMTLD